MRVIDIDMRLLEHLTREARIQILPKFESDALHFVGGRFGPFSPQVPLFVPIWLALELKRQHRCSIMQPKFLNIAYLESLKKKEIGSPPGSLQPISSNFFSIGYMLLKEAADDIEQVTRVSLLLEEIFQKRLSKLRLGMHNIGNLQTGVAPVEFIKLNNATLLEVQALRSILTNSLKNFIKLRATNATEDEAEVFY